MPHSGSATAGSAATTTAAIATSSLLVACAAVSVAANRSRPASAASIASPANPDKHDTQNHNDDRGALRGPVDDGQLRPLAFPPRSAGDSPLRPGSGCNTLSEDL